jgi:hypothetical protein
VVLILNGEGEVHQGKWVFKHNLRFIETLQMKKSQLFSTIEIKLVTENSMPLI